jgi:hypothetical protein
MRSNKRMTNLEKEWIHITACGITSSLLPLLSDISSILIIFSFWTSLPIIYIGFKYDIKQIIITSIIATIITYSITVKENALIFLIFNVIPAIIITTINKKDLYSKKTTSTILALTLYISIIGVFTSFFFNKTVNELYYITENFAKQNGILVNSIKIYISYIPGIFCIGSIGINIINSIIAQKILKYDKKKQKYLT